MKKIITVLLLLILSTPVLAQNVNVTKFDRVYLKAKKEQVPYSIKKNTTVTVYQRTITVKDSTEIYIFRITDANYDNNTVTLLKADSVKQVGVNITYANDFSAIAFDFEDRYIMFFDSKRIQVLKDKLERIQKN